MRRLAEADVVARDQIDSCCTACRGLIIVSTLDFIYRDRALGGDLARRQVHDLLRGFGKSGAATGNGSGLGFAVVSARPDDAPGIIFACQVVGERPTLLVAFRQLVRWLSLARPPRTGITLPSLSASTSRIGLPSSLSTEE